MPRLLPLLILLLILTSCATPEPTLRAGIDAVETLSSGGEGFARAFAPRPFVFPQDHGAHPEYQVEWWYYTGNLRDGERHFGYQLTFFRSALSAEAPRRDSAWGSSQIYMAHLALSDVASGRFYAYERFSRAAAGLAGATGDPFRVFLEDWSAEGSGPEGMRMELRAAEGDIALNLLLTSRKAAVLQGDRGLSQKGPTPGNASFYYSLTRLETTGSLEIAGQRYNVTGSSWMDHEWGTSALEGDATGWDWFSIQLDDDRELMYAQVRSTTGISYSFGSLVGSDGSVTPLDPGSLQLEVLAQWDSPRSGARYPARWRLTLPAYDLTLELVPKLSDQELPLAVIYWEGAVEVRGTQAGMALTGHGYVELTGYVPSQRGRF